MALKKIALWPSPLLEIQITIFSLGAPKELGMTRTALTDFNEGKVKESCNSSIHTPTLLQSREELISPQLPKLTKQPGRTIQLSHSLDFSILSKR